MGFRYTLLQREFKKFYRRFFPVPRSPWTIGKVDDICEINLVPPEKLRAYFANCISILKRTRGNNIGDYLEFGVFNGSSMSSIYLTAKELDFKMRFFGFDAFKGLPKESEKEDDNVWKEGFYSCSFEKMTQCLKKRGINPKEINWVKGWYKDTLNDRTVNKFKINNPGIIFIDCDTYSSSKSVLDFIGPMIKNETILCFDDWKLNDLDIKGMGEYKAFNEFLENNKNLEVREIRSYNRKSKSFIIKPVY